jgi:sugar phosphate isomerase/epimerase
VGQIAESPVTLSLEYLPVGWDVSVFADEISPDLEEQIAEVQRAGLSGIDLRSVWGKNVLTLSDDEVAKIRAAIAASDLSISTIGSPINKLPFSLDNRRQQLKDLKRIIEIANTLEVPRIRIFSPYVESESSSSYEDVREWLAEQVELAQKYDVVLLHENDWKYYGAYPANSMKLLQDLYGPHFKAAFDFSNAVLLGYAAIPHWFTWIIPYLDSLHIKDSVFKKAEEDEDVIVPAGEGDGKMLEVFKILKAEGWQGPLCIEPHLFKIGKNQGLSGVETFRLALGGLNNLLEAASK